MTSGGDINGSGRHGADAARDRDLLARFVRQGDQEAFTALVRKHSGLVYGVAKRILRDRQSAEDAFQATFLVLAQSAGRIRRRRSLAAWLHGVAYRISLRALAKRQRRRETCSPMDTPTTEPAFQCVGELYEQQQLDAELQQLPEKYRTPLVLHYLEGLSNRQVAEQLDLSVSCVEGRLKRGKKELRLRLMRRGVELGAALGAVQLIHASAHAGSLESLIIGTSHVACSQAVNSTAAAAPSETAAQLATQEIAMLASTKTGILLSAAAAVVIAVGLGAGLTAAPGAARAGGGSGIHVILPDTVLPGDIAPSAGDLTAEQVVVAQADDGGDEPAAPPADLRIDALQQQLTETMRQHEREVTELIRRIVDVEQALAAEQAKPVAAEPGGSFVLQPTDAETQKIQAALDGVAELEFPGNPLRDVIEYISIRHSIPILLDEQHLEDQGISPDEEVTLQLSGSGVTLRNALEIMLENVAGVELDYVVENQVMKITTREHADRIMDTHVYSLRQLGDEYRPEDIARVIVRTIAPETWRNSIVPSSYDDYSGFGMEEIMGDMSGMGEMDGGMGMGYGGERLAPTGGQGQGSIEPLPGVLVVTQSQRVHRQITDLLHQLLRHGAADDERGSSPLEEGMFGGVGSPFGGGSGEFSGDGDAGASDFTE